jgi:hypothetical protein
MSAPAGLTGWQRLHADQRGQMMVEWALVLAAFALPMFYVIRTCMEILVAHYQMVTFLITLPFP